MNLRPQSLVLTLAVAAAALAVPVTMSALTITENNLLVNAQDGLGGSSNQFFSGRGIPTNQTITATSGGSVSSVTINYAGVGDQVTLSHIINQQRDGTANGSNQASDGYLYFNVSANTTYALSGQFNVTDVTTAGFVSMSAYLLDMSNFQRPFQNDQVSRNTSNESFTLGGTGGDQSNYVTGSLTGSLLAGRTYIWYFSAYMAAFPEADGGASATGNMTLKIGGGAPPAAPSSVPDGTSTLALIGCMAAGTAIARRKLTPAR